MSILFGTRRRGPIHSTYLAAQVVAGVWVFGAVTCGRAAVVGADYAVQGIRERARVGRGGI